MTYKTYQPLTTDNYLLTTDYDFSYYGDTGLLPPQVGPSSHSPERIKVLPPHETLMMDLRVGNLHASCL